MWWRRYNRGIPSNCTNPSNCIRCNRRNGDASSRNVCRLRHFHASRWSNYIDNGCFGVASSHITLIRHTRTRLHFRQQAIRWWVYIIRCGDDEDCDEPTRSIVSWFTYCAILCMYDSNIYSYTIDWHCLLIALKPSPKATTNSMTQRLESASIAPIYT